MENGRDGLYSVSMALSIVIDGYNLIAALWGMGSGSQALDGQRRNLIGMLAEYRMTKGHPVHVVFDGWRSGDPMGSRTRDSGVEVTFSPKGTTADEVIRDLLRDEGGAGTVVVSSDRQVQGWARDAGAEAIEAWVFAARLTDAGVESGSPETREDEDEGAGWTGTTKKRGNPRRRSRRERAIRRQLKKL